MVRNRTFVPCPQIIRTLLEPNYLKDATFTNKKGSNVADGNVNNVFVSDNKCEQIFITYLFIRLQRRKTVRSTKEM